MTLFQMYVLFCALVLGTTGVVAMTLRKRKVTYFFNIMIMMGEERGYKNGLITVPARDSTRDIWDFLVEQTCEETQARPDQVHILQFNRI